MLNAVQILCQVTEIMECDAVTSGRLVPVFRSKYFPCLQGRKLSFCFEGAGRMCLRNVSKALHHVAPQKMLTFKPPPQNKSFLLLTYEIACRNVLAK
jgi:hypothetical protein